MTHKKKRYASVTSLAAFIHIHDAATTAVVLLMLSWIVESSAGKTYEFYTLPEFWQAPPLKIGQSGSQLTMQSSSCVQVPGIIECPATGSGKSNQSQKKNASNTKKCSSFAGIGPSFFTSLRKGKGENEDDPPPPPAFSKPTPTTSENRLSNLEKLMTRAIISGDTEMVSVLICQINPNTNNYLFLAVDNGHTKIAAMLLDHGASTEQRSDGNTPLHIAVIRDNQKLTSLLIKYRANLEAKNYWGKTPLAMATSLGHMDIARRLISSGANTQAQDWNGVTPMEHAVNWLNEKLKTSIFQLTPDHRSSEGDTRGILPSPHPRTAGNPVRCNSEKLYKGTKARTVSRSHSLALQRDINDYNRQEHPYPPCVRKTGCRRMPRPQEDQADSKHIYDKVVPVGATPHRPNSMHIIESHIYETLPTDWEVPCITSRAKPTRLPIPRFSPPTPYEKPKIHRDSEPLDSDHFENSKHPLPKESIESSENIAQFRGVTNNLGCSSTAGSMLQIEGGHPMSALDRTHPCAVATDLDQQSKECRAVDVQKYDQLSCHLDKTEPHIHHAEVRLYGDQLSTVDQFDSKIGAMEDPVIVFYKSVTETVWHALLLFHNGLTGEYNTVHIRQHSRCPEFMDRSATRHYFISEHQRVTGAISLSRLAEQYGAVLNLDVLRSTFRYEMTDSDTKHRKKNSNCMTFCLSAFNALNFDLKEFLDRMKLDVLHSPQQIFYALTGSPKNQPAVHNINNRLIPVWLTDLGQDEEDQGGL